MSVFETFRRTGAAWATVQAFAKEELKFPRHGQAGSGELIWERLRLIRVTRERFVSGEPEPGKMPKAGGIV
jgi:hypothetical protein